MNDKVNDLVEAAKLLPIRARFELLQNGIQGVLIGDTIDRPRVSHWYACWSDVVLGMEDAPADLLEATQDLHKRERQALFIGYDVTQKQAEAHPGDAETEVADHRAVAKVMDATAELLMEYELRDRMPA